MFSRIKRKAVVPADQLQDHSAKTALSKDKEKEKSRQSIVPSLIGVDIQIIGDLISSGEIQIDGTVEGDVRTRNLTVGEKGIVRGMIFADRARIRGHIQGEINAKSVFLSKTATVQGDILHESLAIEAGAYIDGRCHHMNEQTALIADSTKTEADKVTQEPISNEEEVDLTEKIQRNRKVITSPKLQSPSTTIRNPFAEKANHAETSVAHATAHKQNGLRSTDSINKK